MAVKKIITYPDPVLRQAALPVTEFDDELKQLIADMAETMYAAPGVGLAANQVGVCRQVVVIDIAPATEESRLIVLVNPEITSHEGDVVDEEGCLSVLELSANVKRYKKICIQAQDSDGEPIEFETEDFLARVIQHELDHLQGKLFIDRISSLKRALYKKRLKKILLEKKDEKQE
ncbi:peptide deformylase [Thermodesulfobacteriota bacterium]